MSFDINTIINSAIMQAVEAHLTGIQQSYANRMGEMAYRISQLDSDLSTERASLQTALHRISQLEEENMRQRMNHDKLVERVSDISMWRKAEEASTEIKRSGLDEDRVKEIAKSTFHELWTEVYETEVQDIAERAIDDYDFDDRITGAVRDYDFSDAVESVLEDYDLSSRIEEGIDDYDFGDKLEGAFKERLEEVLNKATISIRI